MYSLQGCICYTQLKCIENCTNCMYDENVYKSVLQRLYCLLNMIVVEHSVTKT